MNYAKSAEAKNIARKLMLKKAKKIFLIIFIGLFIFWTSFSLPEIAFAATATEGFDYTATEGLIGKNGGSNFTSAWSFTSTPASQTDPTITADASCSAPSSGNCVTAENTNATFVYRQFGAITAGGRISFYFSKATETNSEGNAIFFCPDGVFGQFDCSDAGELFSIIVNRPGAGGSVLLRASGGTDNLGSWTENTFQQVLVDYAGDFGSGKGCSSTQVTASFNGGAWSTCRTLDTTGNAGTIQFSGGSSDSFWLDTLSIDGVPAQAGPATAPNNSRPWLWIQL